MFYASSILNKILKVSATFFVRFVWEKMLEKLLFKIFFPGKMLAK